MSTGKTIALLAAALLVLVVVGCGTRDQTITIGTSTTGAPQTTTAPATSDDGLAEEYAVYSALIESMFIDDPQSSPMTQGMFSDAGRPPALIVIEGTTAQPDSGFSPPEAVRFMRNYHPELADEIWSDFQIKNEKPSLLERRFTLGVEYVFLSRQELESVFSKNPSGWEDFYAKYPRSQGILTLSRVGFNEAKDTAVLYEGNQWHGAAGEGNMVLMKKTAGRWTVQDKAMMWTS
jgi:hypothetical protein